MTFAVIKTGGKQYIVKEGDVLSVEKLEHDGNGITFEEVLLVAGDKKPSIGQPLVNGAKVTASVVKEGKGEKKMVFRYKNKTRYKKKKGHRQPFTKVKIEKISAK
jgi:large subunit ribosomal protein L21